MLYNEPFGAVCVVPKVQAHLSAFSLPVESYQAFKSGSEIASSSSCAMMVELKLLVVVMVWCSIPPPMLAMLCPYFSFLNG